MRELTLDEIHLVAGGSTARTTDSGEELSGSRAGSLVGVGLGGVAGLSSGFIAGAIWGAKVGGFVGAGVGGLVGVGYTLATQSP